MYLYAPFMERRARRVTEEEHELSALMAERDRVINSLQELDFDFKLGKIPEEDYPTQRASLLQKGADILRKIDSFAPTSYGKNGHDTEARLEKAIAARRADAAPATTEVSDDDLESLISSRRKGRTRKVCRLLPEMRQARDGDRSILPILWKIANVITVIASPSEASGKAISHPI